MAADAGTLGARIAAARGRAAMTQTQLAVAVSLDRSALAKVENGSRRVSALELSRIADALDERIEWFINGAPESIVSHRNLREPGAPSAAIDRTVERVTRSVEFLRANDDRLVVPALPGLPRPADAEGAEHAAKETRRLLGANESGPLLDLAGVAAEHVGVLGFALDLTPDSADGASVLLHDSGVVLVNGSLLVGRRRLTLAHELGHCLFADEYTVDWRIAVSDKADAWEARLDRFARALLLPAGSVREQWSSYVESGDLRTAAVRVASEFRVDMSTLARRLSELGCIDSGQADRVRRVRTTKADIVELNLVAHDELAAPSLPRPYVESVLRLFRAETVSAARATDLLLDTWDESDLPVLPELPESAIWQFV